MRAREEYFDRAGKVFDDDAELFEGRMASFLEWYVLERPLAGIGLTPVACAIEEGAARAAPTSGGRWRRWRPATAACSSCSRRRRPVLDIEDLIGGARFAVRERRNTAGHAAGDLFEARAHLGRRRRSSSAGPSCSIRPTRARSCSSGSSARSASGVARDEILFHLSRQHIRWHRHGHVGAAKVYRDA